MPQENGSLVWTDKNVAEAYLKSMENERIFGLTTSVNFYLFTKANPEKANKITNTSESINESNFIHTYPTRFIIHGWLQSYSSSMNKKISDAWLSLGDYNIIVVDWSSARCPVYATSVWAVPKAGQKVATMIDFLVENHGMSLDTLIVIGHSLGAHVAGYAGKYIKTGQIYTIIGLDPALPLFSYNKPDQRLSSTDAYYVESIHTNGGELGFLKPIGNSSFYVNGGKYQPGCSLNILGICSHQLSTSYYAEAVAYNDFATIKCKNYTDAVAKDCGSSYSSVHMGSTENSLTAEGPYYVPVNKKSPYGILK